MWDEVCDGAGRQMRKAQARSLTHSLTHILSFGNTTRTYKQQLFSLSGKFILKDQTFQDRVECYYGNQQGGAASGEKESKYKLNLPHSLPNISCCDENDPAPRRNTQTLKLKPTQTGQQHLFSYSDAQHE